LTISGRVAAAGLFVCFLGTEPPHAGTLSLEGPLTQGGLVIGKTEPGAKVTVDGKPVRVSGDGAFLMGFGRDAKAAALTALPTEYVTRLAWLGASKGTVSVSA